MSNTEPMTELEMRGRWENMEARVVRKDDDGIIMSEILASPWERLRRAARAQLGPSWSTDDLAVEVDWFATACAALASRAVAAEGVPEYVEYDISSAIDCVLFETVRVRL